MNIEIEREEKYLTWADLSYGEFYEWIDQGCVILILPHPEEEPDSTCYVRLNYVRLSIDKGITFGSYDCDYRNDMDFDRFIRVTPTNIRFKRAATKN